MLFFYKPGCRDCERVRDQLNRPAAAFPQMTLEERNIESPSEALLNESLATRFRIRDTLHQVAPAVFTQTGALVRDGIDFPALGTLLRDAAAIPPDAAWADAAPPALDAAETRIVHRYAALDRGVLATTGLLDGINPCAFATIIFLLSYLQIARRTLRGGQRDALGLRPLYKAAFIAPLIVIFLLAWAGMRSDALIAFQKKHTALAKVLTGALFLALAVFLVFGHDWLALSTPPRFAPCACCLSIGDVIVLYLLTQNIRFAGVGLVIVVRGCALEVAGMLREQSVAGT